MENALRVSHVSKDYPGFSLKDISFELPKGSVMGLIGQNGGGSHCTDRSKRSRKDHNTEVHFRTGLQ